MKYLISILIIATLTNSCKKDPSGTTITPLEEYVLPGDTLFPEGIVYDPVTRNFYTGSVTNGDIIRVNVETGATSLFAKGDLQNRKAATGMKIDARRRLWISGGGDNKIHVLDI